MFEIRLKTFLHDFVDPTVTDFFITIASIRLNPKGITHRLVLERGN